MERDKGILSRVSIASPCSADWDKMEGNERVRFCLQCTKHVYNLSAMSNREAEQLVTETEGKICVRFFQRKDGTMLTDDCPVGLRIVRAGYKKIYAVAATIASIFLYLIPARAENQEKDKSNCAVHPWKDGMNSPLMGQVVSNSQSPRSEDEALKAKLAIKGGSKTSVDYVTVAWANFKLGLLQDAMAECNQALSLNSNSSAAYDTRARVELQLKQYDNAVADFSKAISIDSSLGSSHYFRAQAYRALGKLDLALADEKKAKDLGYVVSTAR